MQVRKTNYLVNATPTFQVLGEDEIEAIYFSALRVLSETGVRVYEKEGVEVAYSGGAIVEDTTDDSSLVKMPPWMVDRARATLPRKVVVGGARRSPAPDGALQEPDLLRRRLRHAVYARPVHRRAAARDLQRRQELGPPGRGAAQL